MTSPSSQPMRSRSNQTRWTWLALPPHGHVLSWCSLASQTARMFLPEASTLTRQGTRGRRAGEHPRDVAPWATSPIPSER